MKKISVILVLSAVIVSSFPIGAHAVSTSAVSAILIEAESGNVIYEKNADERRGPASTTKIMTALIALEKCPLDRIVKVAPEAVGVEGSSVYLYPGEEITMESLLYALMLGSANDAAAAIAYEIAGGIDEFASLMNEKASSLRLYDTHFDNPHGLDSESHYTTARDLAALSRAALQNEAFGKIVSTKKTSIQMHGGEATRVLVNHNRLLREYGDVIGVKTGFTKKCGRTLVSAAEQDGVRLIAVTLCDGDDWRDHRALLDYGFSLYESVELCDDGDFKTEIMLGGGRTAIISASARVTATLPKERGEISVKEEFLSSLQNAKAGDAAGYVYFYLDGKQIGMAELSVNSKTERQ